MIDLDLDNFAEGFVVLDSQGGRFHLQPDGREYPPGSFSGFPANHPFRLLDPQGYAWPFFKGLDIHRDAELDESQQGLVLFDGWGGIHPVPVNEESSPVYFATNRISNSDPSPRFPVGMPYVVRGFDDPSSANVNESDPQSIGLDVASIFADLEFNLCGGGLYTLDRFGAVFTFGNARRIDTDTLSPFSGSPYFFPYLYSVDLELFSTEETGFLLN